MRSRSASSVTVPRIEIHGRVEVSERRDHARALFAPLGPDLRPGRRDPLVRAGSPLAPRRWSRASRATAAPCSTSRRAPVSSPSAARCRRPPRDRARPEPRHARASRGSGSATASSSSRHRRPRSPSLTPRSTTSRSRTCSATSTTPAPRWPSLPGSSAPGGTIANLEFCVPRGVWRPLWDLYVGVGLPAAGRVVSRGWYDVGRFLGPSIRGLLRAVAARAPARALARGRHRRRAGATHEPRRRRRDLGDPEVRPAFYALRAGRLARLRDAAAPALHGLASLLRRRRRLPRRRASRGIGSGSPCSPSSSRWASAPMRSTSSPAGRSGRRSPRRSSSSLAVTSVVAACAIGIAVALELQPLDPAADRDRGVPRAGLQPRALRRPVPLRPLVRRSRGARSRSSPATSPARARPRLAAVIAGGLGDRPLARPAPALDTRAARPAGRRRRSTASSSSRAATARRSRGSCSSPLRRPRCGSSRSRPSSSRLRSSRSPIAFRRGRLDPCRLPRRRAVALAFGLWLALRRARSRARRHRRARRRSPRPQVEQPSRRRQRHTRRRSAARSPASGPTRSRSSPPRSAGSERSGGRPSPSASGGPARRSPTRSPTSSGGSTSGCRASPTTSSGPSATSRRSSPA